MPVRIRLSDSSVFVVDGAFEDLQDRVIGAINENVPFIQVRNGNGQMRSINPRLITSIEETDDASLTPGEELILDSVHPREPQPQ